MIFTSILRATLLACWLAAAAAQAAPVGLSGLIGSRVSDARGARVGTVHDFAVDVAAGEVRYAVVEQPETSTGPRQVTAVPFTGLRPGLGRDQLVVDDASKMHEAPASGGASAHLLRAKAILGMQIDHPAGSDYGTIDDLNVELETGRVLNAEVLLAAAPARVKREVPFSALRFLPAEDKAILTLATGAPLPAAQSVARASQLLGLPARDPRSGAAGRIEELVLDLQNNRVHYAVVDLLGRRVAQPLERVVFRDGEALLTDPRAGPVPARADMALVRASTLLGWQVENEPGIDLGRISEVLVDPATGRVPFAVVRLREAGNAPLRAVRLDAFAMYPMREDLVFTGAKDALAAAEGFAAVRTDAGFVERHADLARALSEPPAATGATGMRE